MALGLTQSLTEMSTRNLPGGKGRSALKSEKLYNYLLPNCIKDVGSSTSHNLTGLQGMLQEYLYFYKYVSIL
jgi:hypothetical protein